MSHRDWKPGDVAMVECGDGKERMALCRSRFLDGDLVWLFLDNALRDVDNSQARPLAVIDPEDREAVERFRDLADDAYVAQTGRRILAQQRPDRANAMQAALREFAALPSLNKPEEPLGDGAVVEDDKGVRWVRTGLAFPWVATTDRVPSLYSDLAVVRVLSEGVTSDG